ncbi:AAA-like domain-containing protein [Okeania sp. SIO3B5]|uniref:AAA-like domain-containing protein n=1 Tax=Okeania sp. SIO3B5 TaxID=2607811 RepID=UPI0025D8904D|nr:AAA-like domain-containing protein [Okeania sp. SIO3B5]
MDTKQTTDSIKLDFVLETINRKLLETNNHPLSTTEVIILQGIWDNKTYDIVAEEASYSSSYLSNVVAPELFRRISDIIGQRVTKKSCRVQLQTYLIPQATSKKTFLSQDSGKLSSSVRQLMSPIFPSGSISLDSPFYIKRADIEKQVYAEIEKPGALVRIKAPQEMGKTSLLLRVINYAESLDYRTVNLDLQQVGQDILSGGINKFLRWFCANIAHQLNLEPNLNDYWDEDIGSKISCSLYFRNYLLQSTNSPLLLALDEVNQIFEYPEIAKDFFPLLRSWYEEAKRLPVWQNLRLVVVHSTEIYVPLQLKQSPFNVGLPIQLGSFSLEAVLELAQSYGLDWSDEKEANLLMATVGGHPALVHLAIYHLSREDVTMRQLLETAATSTGIYGSHLRRHQVKLEEEPELTIAMQSLVNTNEPILLESIIAYKLSSMGLIKFHRNKATLTCDLYRQYFRSQQ